MTGCVVSLTAALTSTPTAPTPTAPTTHSIYVVQHTAVVLGASQTVPDQVLQFPSSANGSVTPTSTLTIANGSYVTSLAMDGAGNLFVGVGRDGAASILVYAPGSSGTVPPTRTLAGSATGLDTVKALNVDGSGQIFASTGSAVSVFAPNAAGDVAPARVISIPTTLLSADGEISATALDSASNLYVALSSVYDCHILVFPSSTSGVVSPTRTIGGDQFGLGACTGMAVDAPGTIYASVSVETYAKGSIYKFPAGANGNVAPTDRVDSQNAGTISGIAVDASGDIYTVCNDDDLSGFPGELIFPPSGDLSGPIRANITSSVWTGTTSVMAMD